jgi:lysophospholipase L1-like esterase
MKPMSKPEWFFLLIVIQPIIMISHATASTPGVFFKPDDKRIRYTGRIDFSDPQKPRISGAGSTIQFTFRGGSCDVLFENSDPGGNHGYIAVVIDGEYKGRIKVEGTRTVYTVAKDMKDADHTVLVCKATEAMTGAFDFLGIVCPKIRKSKSRPKRKIEFIGNSITCGTGLDLSEVPCGKGVWHDQHNAYLAYGPVAARKLNADWLLSSVSGIGVTRTWNGPGPTMPEVYGHTFLNADSSSLWEAGRTVPDLISICLGTNDFSDGDGIHARTALDSARFIDDYVRFIKTLQSRHPRAQICLLTSPTLSGAKGDGLRRLLEAVLFRCRQNGNDARIHLFSFSRSFSHGCDGHPDQKEHEEMAGELLPFFKKVMNW